MYQYWLINDNKYITLIQNLIVGETVDRRRSIWEFSVVVVNISMNLKLLQVTESIDSKEEV